MGDITIDEDELSDAYDAMDEDAESVGRRRQERQRQKEPQHKYMDLLQKLANRLIDEIIIDLDDLATVSRSSTLAHPPSIYIYIYLYIFFSLPYPPPPLQFLLIKTHVNSGKPNMTTNHYI